MNSNGTLRFKMRGQGGAPKQLLTCWRVVLPNSYWRVKELCPQIATDMSKGGPPNSYWRVIGWCPKQLLTCRRVVPPNSYWHVEGLCPQTVTDVLNGGTPKQLLTCRRVVAPNSYWCVEGWCPQTDRNFPPSDTHSHPRRLHSWRLLSVSM